MQRAACFYSRLENKRKKRFLSVVLSPNYQKSKIFPKSLPLSPSRHPIICLALELDHMATPDCQGGKLGMLCGGKQPYIL